MTVTDQVLDETNTDNTETPATDGADTVDGGDADTVAGEE